MKKRNQHRWYSIGIIFRSTLVSNDVVVVSLFENERKITDSVVPNNDPELVSRLRELSQNKSVHDPIIPILVIACNRISIRSCLEDLVRYRPDSNKFPIIVSQVGEVNLHLQQFFFGKSWKFNPSIGLWSWTN